MWVKGFTNKATKKSTYNWKDHMHISFCSNWHQLLSTRKPLSWKYMKKAIIPLFLLSRIKAVVIRWLSGRTFSTSVEFPVRSLYLQRRKLPWSPGSWSPTLLWDGRPCWRRPLDTQTGQKVYNLWREEMGKWMTYSMLSTVNNPCRLYKKTKLI